MHVLATTQTHSPGPPGPGVPSPSPTLNRTSPELATHMYPMLHVAPSPAMRPSRRFEGQRARELERGHACLATVEAARSSALRWGYRRRRAVTPHVATAEGASGLRMPVLRPPCGSPGALQVSSTALVRKNVGAMSCVRLSGGPQAECAIPRRPVLGTPELLLPGGDGNVEGKNNDPLYVPPLFVSLVFCVRVISLSLSLLCLLCLL